MRVSPSRSHNIYIYIYIHIYIDICIYIYIYIYIFICIYMVASEELSVLTDNTALKNYFHATRAHWSMYMLLRHCS